MKLKLRRLARIVVVTLLGAWLFWGLAVFAYQRRLLFPRPAQARTVEVKGASLLHIPSSTGEVLALYFRARPGSRTIAFFHGNGEQLADLITLGRLYASSGFGFLAVEYPGYGLAPGSPSEASIEAAAQTALAYAHDDLHVRDEDLVLVGWSLGSAVAADLAQKGYGTKLILMSPWTSVAEIGKGTLPYHSTRLMVLDPFDTESKAPTIQQPTLILHGDKDELIPTAMGVRLGKLFPHAELELVPGAGHDIAMRGEVLSRIATFVAGRP